MSLVENNNKYNVLSEVFPLYPCLGMLHNCPQF